MMPPCYHLMFLSFFLPSLAAAAAAQTGISNNCPTHSVCGNIQIPYPFGVGSPPAGCQIEPSFSITCDTSSGTPKPYLTINNTTNYEVLEFQLSTSQVRVRNPPLGGAKYVPLPKRANEAPSPPEAEEEDAEKDQPANITRPIDINLSHTLYTLSETNSITFIGCDDFVRISGIKSKVFAGCTSICIKNSTDGNCPEDRSTGNGCCQYPIPRGTASLSLNFTDMHEHSREGSETRLYPWSYAFIGEKQNSSFSYKLNALNDNETFQNDYQGAINRSLVLDWRMGNQNCSQAKMNTSSYACKGISNCRDFGDGVEGYICRCKEGYQGNPYVSNATLGCSDINECLDSTKYDCKPPSRCKNTPGGYECSCPVGYKKHDSHSCSPSAWITALIGVSSGIGFLLLLAMCYCLHLIFKKTKDKKRKKEFFKHNGGLLLQQQSSGGVFGKMNLFTADELEKATDHFNENRVLGQGGHGTVFKGILTDGRNVAVKKAKLLDQNQLEQFINEMVILSQINHKHIVKLFGCCLETEVPLLVYEFVPNGTLFNLLHDSSIEFPFTWRMRLKIASDTAGAIAYLHSASSIPVYHRDIKSSNILLDEKYVVKVSDFGGSRLVPVDHTHVTTMVTGTFGYLDPEFFQSGQFTEKSDVYSFGVVLVELLTGEKPISFNRAHDERSLASHFIVSMEANSIEKVLDEEVLRGGGKEEVMTVARLAKRCLNSRGKLRPTMRVVASELEKVMNSDIGMTSGLEEEEEEALIDRVRVGHEPNFMMHTNYDYSWTFSTTGSSPPIDHPLTKDRP